MLTFNKVFKKNQNFCFKIYRNLYRYKSYGKFDTTSKKKNV